MLREIEQAFARCESFAFETTLAGTAYLRHIEEWRKGGYHVSLFFLGLPDADMAVARLAARVLQGGHDIPERVIRRGFAAGQKNFNVYRAAVDTWVKYDNSGDEPLPIEWGDDEEP